VKTASELQYNEETASSWYGNLVAAKQTGSCSGSGNHISVTPLAPSQQRRQTEAETHLDQSNSTPWDDEILKALEVLQKADEFLRLGSRRDVVLVAGDRASIENTFKQHFDRFYAMAALGAVETHSGEFVFEEGHDSSVVGARNTLLQLFVNTDTDTAFCLFPIFNKTGRISEEILSAYLIKQILQSSRSVTVIFSVCYPSVVKVTKKEDLVILVMQYAKLISNMSKFKDGVGLLLTTGNETELNELQDREIINSAAEVLTDVKEFISEKYHLQEKISTERSKYESVIQVIDTLLTRDNDDYKKIGIFRGSRAPPNISEDSEGYNMDLLTVIQGYTAHVKQESDDFRVELSDELRNKLYTFVNYVNEAILKGTSIVATDILQYYRSREKHLGPNNVIRLIHELETGHRILSDMIRNISESPEPKKFSKIIFNVLQTLQVNTAIDNLIDTMRQCKYLEFLQVICGQGFVNARVTEWVNPLINIVNEIGDSKEWYLYLVKTHDTVLELGDPAVSSSAGRREVRSAEGRKWRVESGSHGIAGYENITGTWVGDTKLQAMVGVMRSTTREKTAVSCVDGNKIVATGTLVKVSEVSVQKCEKELKSIEIFASDVVLLDVDLEKVGERVHVTILAPRWNIKGQRSITLNGSDGRRHVPPRAAVGLAPGHRGEDGKPGLPGGNAGSYFAMAKEYLAGGSVTIYTNGGRGGPGQDGGSGAEGRTANTQVPSDGDTCDAGPTHVRSHYHITQLEKWKRRWSCFCFYDLYEYEFYNLGGRGGRGGNGGQGGFGGREGEHKQIHLNGSGSWEGFGAEGTKGENGAEGKGGLGGIKGDTIIMQCTTDWYLLFSIYRWTEISRVHSTGRGPPGRDGIRGWNSEGMIRPADRNRFAEAPSSIINRYKVYLISSLDDVINKQSLGEFITLLNSDPQVQSTYDTLAFVDELKNLESQFYKQRTEVDFLPVYRSLLLRIKSYAENPKPHESSEEYKTVLVRAYTATLGKICALREASGGNLVTDIEGYLDLTTGYIQELKEAIRLEDIEKTRDDYKNKLNEKIVSANDFIMKEVSPEIEIIRSKSKESIEKLIAEVLGMQESGKEEEKELRKKQKELQNSLLHRIGSGSLSILSGALSSLSSVGHAAVNLISQDRLVSEPLSVGGQTRDRRSVQFPDEMRFAVQREMARVESATYSNVRAMRHVVAALLQAMRQNPMFLRGTEGAVKGIEGRLDKVGKYDLEIARKLQDELTKLITRGVEEFKTFHDKRVRTGFKVVKRSAKLLVTLKSLGTVAKMFQDLYMKYKDNEEALKEIGDAIEKAQDKFDKLRQYEDEIQNSLIPMMRAIHSEMVGVQGTLGSQSGVALQVTGWKVQSTLKDIKLHLRQFTKGFEIQEDLDRCVDKLDETMTTLIGVYDRIQSYVEQKELADYVADIASLRIRISDYKLWNSVIALQKTISLNTLFGHYERAIAAVKQWLFPFGEQWLSHFKLPSHRTQDSSYQNFVTVITEQLQTLKSKLRENKVSIIKDVHSNIHTAVFDSSYKSSRPFYVWDNKRYRKTIQDLLAGKEVVLKADIFRGESKNAVKFNAIEIHFKATNKTAQEAVNAMLSYFHVRLTHHGNSYYRCGANYYVMRGDKQTIVYSGERRENGEPMDHNSVYRKLKDADIMLSPYATWSIRLVNVTDVNFSELVNFGHLVDVELTGQGQYVAENADVCNRDLRALYEPEGSIWDYDSVM
jgi:uncharacterized protein YicC (UPF0701 family)